MRLLIRVCAVSLLVWAAGAPTLSSAQSGPTVIAGVPLLRQQHSLTCESSAVSMATRGEIAESQLMASMPRSFNPNLGFRGSPNGIQGTKLINYGVYAGPLQQALLRFGYNSTVLQYAFDGDIKGYINRGWPVVAWITYGLQKATPRLVSQNGVQFVLVPHEHAITVVGYDASTVIANDPWTGREVRYYWSAFNRSWGYFGDMALAVEPCQMALPVARVSVAALSNSGITLTWVRPGGAVHFLVTATRYGAAAKVVFNGMQDALQFTLNNPSPGKLYEFDVRSVSGCGDQAAPSTVWVRAPDVMPTPPEGTVAPVTVTPTSTRTQVAGTSAPTTTPVPPTSAGSSTPSPSPTLTATPPAKP